MADLAAGESFVDGEDADAARLNNHVNGARIQKEFISGQSTVTPASGDKLVFYDISGEVLGQNTLDTLVRTIATTDAANATGSLRTLNQGSGSALAYTSRSASVTGVRLGSGEGSSDTAATMKDYVQAPDAVSFAGGNTQTANAALNLNFTLALPATTQACTLNVHSFPNGGTVRALCTQGGTGASTLAIATFSDAGSTGLTEKVIGADTISNATNKVDLITMHRFGSTVTILFNKDFA